MTPAAEGAMLGLLVGAGLLLVMSWIAARRPASVAVRIRPQVSGPSSAPQSSASIGGLLMAVAGRSDIRARLARAGIADSPGRYRLEQAVWAALGACAGAVVAVLVGARGPAGAVVLPVAGAVVGAVARDWSLGRRSRKRRERIDAELPAAAELLAFAVAAGEGPHAALARVTQCMDGELSREFRIANADVRSGLSLELALQSMAGRIASTGVSRLVDGLLLAVERGTPLAEVLRAQAADAQADGRRRLMELAGRKDVAMLVPVVFLILPTVVVVALFPGLQSLRLVAP